MKNDLLVSIWIPTYNNGHLIWKSIESAINQTYKNIEVVVFDDASSDGTEEVVKRYIEKDKRVRYFNTGKNIGTNKSFPKAIEMCRGELTIFLCSDDWLSKNYIEECVKLFIEHPDAGAVTGRVFSIFEKEGRWIFSREPEVKPGIYTRAWFAKNAYKTFITSMIILGMVRKEDALKAARQINEVVDNPPSEINEELRAMMQCDYGGEWIFCAEAMADHSELCVSNKAVLLKSENDFEHYLERKGSTKLRVEFGHGERTAKGILKFYYYSRILYDVAYKNDWSDYISTTRIFFGREAFATVIMEIIKNRFSRGFFKGFSFNEDVGIFFDGYSLFEKVVSVLLIIPRITTRLFASLGRRFFRVPQPDIYRPEYFLDEKGHFIMK